MSDHPSSELTGVFGKPFPEQVAFFRQKLGNLVPTRVWTDMLAEEHDRGFMVAGAMKADLLTDLAAAVDKAIAEGRGIEEFRRDFRAIVAKNGWTGWTGEGSVKGEAWRVKTILRTNAYTSYSAGRFAQLKAGNFAFWVYRHGGSLEPRPEHLSWNGVALPPDHPFWNTHYPPSAWGCSCYVVGADTAAGVRRLRGDPDKKLPGNWQSIDPKTGTPVGIGRGWGYAPGKSVTPLVQVMAEKMRQWPAFIGAHYGQSIAPQIESGWADWVAAARTKSVQTDGLVGTLHYQDVVALDALGQTPASAEIYFRAGLIDGPKAARHAAKGDELSAADIDRLPELLRKPSAVLFDNRSGKLIYMLKGPLEAPQFVLGIDYKRRGMRDKSKANVVVSAYRQKIEAITKDVSSGELTLLRGSIL